MTNRHREFFAFAKERHQIHINREAGLSRSSWTEDAILSKYRFTNVFRELDRTTVWFREMVRDPVLRTQTEFDQLLGTILFRTFNRIETGEAIFCQITLLDSKMLMTPWAMRWEQTTSEWIHTLRTAIYNQCRPGPYVTGAYIVKTPDMMTKLNGALWIIEQAERRLEATLAAPDPVGGSTRTLEGLHKQLCTYPYLGGFTAYEIVSDLRWLPILESAPDILTWAHAGPGAKRGVNRVLGRDKNHSVKQDECLTVMEMLLALSRTWDMWPQHWPAWEMREVEHTLCEWDKYERVRLGEGRPRGVYR